MDNYDKGEIIESFVLAVKEKQHFRQLSSYSIECITKLLNQNEHKLQEFADRAVKCGAVEAVSKVMFEYSEDEEVFIRCIDCLLLLFHNFQAILCFSNENYIEKIFVSIERLDTTRREKSLIKAFELTERVLIHPDMLHKTDVNQLIIRIITFVEHNVSVSKLCIAALSILNTFSHTALFFKYLCNDRTIKLLLVLFAENCGDGEIETNTGYNCTLITTDTLLNLIQHNSQDAVRIIKYNKGDEIYMSWVLKRNLQRQCILKEKIHHLLKIIIGDNADVLMHSIYTKIIQKNNQRNVENDMQQLVAIAIVKPSILSPSQFTEKYAATILKSFGIISPKIDIAILKLFSTLAAHYCGIEVVSSVDAVPFFKKCLITAQSSIENIPYTLDWMIYSFKSKSSSLCSIFSQLDCQVIEILATHEKEEYISRKALSFLCLLESSRGNIGVMSNIYEDYPAVIVSVIFEHKHNAKIQILGGKILVKLFSIKRFQDTVVDDVILKLIQQMAENFQTFPNNMKLVHLSLVLLANLPSRKTIACPEVLYTIINAICDSLFDATYDEQMTSVLTLFVRANYDENFLEYIRARVLLLKDESIVESEQLTSLLKITCVLMATNPFELKEIKISIFQIISNLVMSFKDYQKLDTLKIISAFDLLFVSSKEFCLLLNEKILSFACHILQNQGKQDLRILKRTLNFLGNVQQHNDEFLNNFDFVWEGIIFALSLSMHDKTAFNKCTDLLFIYVKKGFCMNLIRKGILKSIHIILRKSRHDFIEETLICKMLILLKEMLRHGPSVVDKFRKSGINFILVEIFLMKQLTGSSRYLSIICEILKCTLCTADTKKMIRKVKSITKCSTNMTLSEYEELAQSVNVLMIDGLVDEEERVDIKKCVLVLMKSKIQNLEFKTIFRLFIKILCGKDSITYDASFSSSDDFVSPLIKMLEESPSQTTVKMIHFLVENNYTRDILDVSTITNTLMKIVAIGNTDKKLVQIAINTLQLLVKSSARASEIVMEDICFQNICRTASNSIMRENDLGLAESLELLVHLGNENPKILLHGSIFRIISDICISNMMDALFILMMKLIRLITSCQEGLKRFHENDFVKTLFGSLSKKRSIFYCSKKINITILTMNKLKKSHDIASSLYQQGVDVFFEKMLRRNIHHSVMTSELLSKLVRLLPSKERLNDISVQIRSIEDEAKEIRKKPSKITIAKIIELLKNCYVQILIIGPKSLIKSEALKLLRHMQYISIGIRSINQKSDIGLVRYFVLLIFNQILSVPRMYINCEAFIIDCAELATGARLCYRECSYCCIGKIVKQRQGVKNIARKELMISLHKAVSLSGQYSASSNDMPIDLRQAKVTLMIILNELSSNLSSFLNDTEGVNAMVTILYNIPCDLVQIFLTKLCELNSHPFDILIRLLKTFLSRQHYAFPVDQILEFSISIGMKSSTLNFEGKDVIDFVKLCRVYPLAIQILQRISEFPHGCTIIASCPNTILDISNLIPTNMDVACSCSSIFSKCVLSRESVILDQLKDADVAQKLLETLEDRERQKCSNLVKNTVHVVAHLLSVYEMQEIQLKSKSFDILRSILEIHQDNEYIQSISKDILALLHDKDPHIVNDQIKKIQSLLSVGKNNELDSHTISKDIESELQIAVEMILTIDQMELKKKEIMLLFDLLNHFKQQKKHLLLILEIFQRIGDLNYFSEKYQKKVNCSDIIHVVKYNSSDVELLSKLFEVLAMFIEYGIIKYERLSDIRELLAQILIVLMPQHKRENLLVKGLSLIRLILNEFQKPSYMARLNPHKTLSLVKFLSDIIISYQSNRCLFLLILSILGLLSVSDENIPMIIENNLVKTVTEALKDKVGDLAAHSLTIKFISNLGTLKNQSTQRNVTLSIGEQGGLDFLLKCYETYHMEHSELGYLLDAFYNLFEVMIKFQSWDSSYGDILHLSFATIDIFYDDPKLMYQSLKIISLFTVTPKNAVCVLKRGGFKYFLQALCLNNNCSSTFLEIIMSCIANLLRFKDGVDEATKNWNFTTSLIDCLIENPQSGIICNYILSSLSMISTFHNLLHFFRQNDLLLVVKNVYEHLNDVTIASLFVEVLRQISKYGNNCITLTQNEVLRLLYHIHNSFSRDIPIITGVLQISKNLISSLGFESIHIIELYHLKESFQIHLSSQEEEIQQISHRILSLIYSIESKTNCIEHKQRRNRKEKYEFSLRRGIHFFKPDKRE